MTEPSSAALRICHFARTGALVDGSPEALRKLAEWIAGRSAAAPPISIAAECESEGGHALTEVRLERDVGPVHITIEGRTLVLRGGCEQLGVVATNLTWFATTADPGDPGAHMHEEYYELPGREHHLAPDAEPLVVGFFRPGASPG